MVIDLFDDFLIPLRRYLFVPAHIVKITVINQIDKYRRHCLWRGAEAKTERIAKAAWPLVCIPKEEGGLGILNLQTHNEALLLKHLSKFFSRENLPWVELIWDKHYRNGKLPSSKKPKGSFWWRDILKLLDKFKGWQVC